MGLLTEGGVGVTVIRGVLTWVAVGSGLGVDSTMQATVISSAHVSHSQIVRPMVCFLSAYYSCCAVNNGAVKRRFSQP